MMRHLDLALIGDLHHKTKSNQLITSKADWGNALVIMERALYHSNIIKIIEDMGGVESGGLGFYAYVSKAKKVIGGSSHIL